MGGGGSEVCRGIGNRNRRVLGIEGMESIFEEASVGVHWHQSAAQGNT